MVRRGWRDFLYLNNATAEAKAKVFLNLGKAVAAGTIENVGASSARTEANRENQGRNIIWTSVFLIVLSEWDLKGA